MLTASRSIPATIWGWVLPSPRRAWWCSSYDTSVGPCSCSYMALSTHTAAGIAGGMNPVRPSPHSSSSQSVAPCGTSGHRLDIGFGSSDIRSSSQARIRPSARGRRNETYLKNRQPTAGKRSTPQTTAHDQHEYPEDRSHQPFDLRLQVGGGSVLGIAVQGVDRVLRRGRGVQRQDVDALVVLLEGGEVQCGAGPVGAGAV